MSTHDNDNEYQNISNLDISIFNRIDKLPMDIVNIIKEYIPFTSLVFTNKENYLKYHYLLKIKLREHYIRNIIRRDYDFVFERILNEKYKKWIMLKQYMYKNIIYGNYIYFLKDYCLTNESNKCRIILNQFLENTGLCKNQNKKITSKHIRWKN